MTLAELYFIGVDPGCDGAATVIDENGDASTFCFGKATESDLISFFIDCKRGAKQCFAVVESVHSMPKQGVASTFKFGRAYGFVRGAIMAACIPFDEATPQAWQRELKCMTKGDKNVSKARAQQLFPGLKVTNKTGDSVCIAEFARRQWYQRHGMSTLC